MGICLATNARVAIKIMNEREEGDAELRQRDPSAVRLFLNEIRICAKAHHRNIIKIIDFNVGGLCRLPNQPVRHVMYYVMKIAPYGELHRIIK
jgi:serine/threonine protein kinase